MPISKQAQKVRPKKPATPFIRFRRQNLKKFKDDLNKLEKVKNAWVETKQEQKKYLQDLYHLEVEKYKIDFQKWKAQFGVTQEDLKTNRKKRQESQDEEVKSVKTKGTKQTKQQLNKFLQSGSSSKKVYYPRVIKQTPKSNHFINQSSNKVLENSISQFGSQIQRIKSQSNDIQIYIQPPVENKEYQTDKSTEKKELTRQSLDKPLINEQLINQIASQVQIFQTPKKYVRNKDLNLTCSYQFSQQKSELMSYSKQSKKSLCKITLKQESAYEVLLEIPQNLENIEKVTPKISENQQFYDSKIEVQQTKVQTKQEKYLQSQKTRVSQSNSSKVSLKQISSPSQLPNNQNQLQKVDVKDEILSNQSHQMTKISQHPKQPQDALLQIISPITIQRGDTKIQIALKILIH